MKPETIKAFIRTLPFLPDIKRFFDILEENYSAEIIIISDSNSIFIDELLDSGNLHGYIKKIFTNPASFDDVSLF